MAWRRPGKKPLSEQMVVRLLTYICVTQPQWVDIERALSTFMASVNSDYWLMFDFCCYGYWGCCMVHRIAQMCAITGGCVNYWWLLAPWVQGQLVEVNFYVVYHLCYKVYLKYVFAHIVVHDGHSTNICLLMLINIRTELHITRSRYPKSHLLPDDYELNNSLRKCYNTQNNIVSQHKWHDNSYWWI